jgi:hypothetical protein
VTSTPATTYGSVDGWKDNNSERISQSFVRSYMPLIYDNLGDRIALLLRETYITRKVDMDGHKQNTDSLNIRGSIGYIEHYG